MSRRTKAARRESFRTHADGGYTRIPRWARVSAEVTLSPAGREKFCELVGLDGPDDASAEVGPA